MYQVGSRDKFNKKFYSFIKPIDLNVKFMNSLKEHACKEWLEDVMSFKDNDMAMKCRIFGEFTMSKENANQLARYLNESGVEANINAAKELRKFNQSEQQMEYLFDIHIPVTKAKSLTSDNSQQIKMDSNPRGMAIIFVTLAVLFNEAERFKQIFADLMFTPEVIVVPTCAEINAKLDAVAKLPPGGYHGDAFIMMFIGHGENERIIGCPDSNTPNNTIPIIDIVDKFSKVKCYALADKPKIFIFNCCRTSFKPKSAPGVTNVPQIVFCPNCHSQSINTINTIGTKFINNNRQTYVMYACAEGLKSWYEGPKGDIVSITRFGQTLSHTIAHYSWYKNLYQLFIMTVNRMDNELGPQHRPEINVFAANKELYFNPGQWKDKDNANIS